MKRLRAVRRRNGERKDRRLNWTGVMRAGMGLLTWAALCLMLLGYDLFPGRISLHLGEPSPELVRAPRMARYEDDELDSPLPLLWATPA